MTRRTTMFVSFFSIVLLLYAALNLYIFVKGWYSIPDDLRPWFAVVFPIVALSYIAGRVLERFSISWLSSTLVWVGSLWLAAMVYFQLLCLAIDILRLIDHVLPIFPAIFAGDPTATRHTVAAGVCAAVAAAVAGGYVNARTPRVKPLDVTVERKSAPSGSLTVAVASDIHLGTIICKSRLEQIVQKINELTPDLVLLPGDVVDEDLGPVINQNLGETLRAIKARLGVFAITGNHEYIGGAEKACQYLSDHGIRMLRDESVVVDNRFTLIGREDRSIAQFEGKKRKSLEELMTTVDRSLPVVLLDHQPIRLEEAERNGVDLQLSGHTHHGQMWPFHWITKRVYEASWGYLRKGATQFYVSCGVGTWGPPVRIGNSPEIMNIRLKFN